MHSETSCIDLDNVKIVPLAMEKQLPKQFLGKKEGAWCPQILINLIQLLNSH